MGLKPDHWIRRMALEQRMIEPFVDGQVRDGDVGVLIVELTHVQAIAAVVDADYKITHLSSITAHARRPMPGVLSS